MHYAVFTPGLTTSQGCLMYDFGCWRATWTCTLLAGAHRMLLGRHTTVERWRPPRWCQAGPAWRQTPLLTGAPAVWSLLKSRILSMPSSPAMCRTHLCERVILIMSIALQHTCCCGFAGEKNCALYLQGDFHGTIWACGSRLLKADCWALLWLHSSHLRPEASTMSTYACNWASPCL